MRLSVFGSSPPKPNPGTPCSSYLVSTKSTSVLLDCGHGSVPLLMQYPLDELTAIVISHFHPDHFADLFALRNSRPSNTKVPLIIPRGSLEILYGIINAIGLERDYFSKVFEILEVQSKDMLTIGEATMSFASAAHPLNCQMVDIKMGGQRLVYSADTGLSKDLVAFARNADLLLIECTSFDLALEGHLNVRDVAAVYDNAQPGQMIVTHYPQSSKQFIEGALLERFSTATIDMAKPGKSYELS